MILLLADLRQFVIIFLLFRSWITPTAIWSWQRKNTKQDKKTTKQTITPSPTAMRLQTCYYLFFLLVNFRQIMWNSIFIKMSGKKTMFQRQHVSLSKKYNAAGSGALYMQTGTRKITRNANKIRCWLQKLNL